MTLATLLKSDLADVFLDTDEFAVACTYRHKAHALSVSLIPGPADQTQGQKAVMAERFATAQVDEFVGSIHDFTAGGKAFLPAAYDEITWTDPQGTARTSVVFPLVGDQCYRFSDTTRHMVRVYTVNKASMTEVRLLTADQSTVDVKALGIVTSLTGQELFVESGQTVKLMQTLAFLPRSVFAGVGITVPPIQRQVECLGLKWSINLSQTEWGEGLVKLGLEREALSREWQARPAGEA